MSRAPQIGLVSVDRDFGTRSALRSVSVVFAPGERVAIVGPSGSGKSTLLRLVGGALRASRGQVTVDGADLGICSRRELQEYRRRLSFIEQLGGLATSTSVHQNVVAGLLPTRTSAYALSAMFVARDKDRVAAVLGQVGLADRQWDVVSSLSGGQQQRVAVARALISEPDVLLADEPTASLDPTTAEEIVETLCSRPTQLGSTLVVSTHWASLAQARVDRMLGIRDGELVFDRPAAEVRGTDFDAVYAGSRERR